MNLIIYLLVFYFISNVKCDDVLGCGGFIKSHVQIDFSKVEIRIYTKQGILKDQTSCAPNNGYYFIPLYDKGDYILKLQPPPGWSFSPTEVALEIDGSTDLCSQGKDINFVFQGFGITGKVESFQGNGYGPAGIEVELKHANHVRRTVTTDGGSFFFTPVFPGQYSVTVSHSKWKFVKNSLVVKVTEGNTELPSGSLIVAGFGVSGLITAESFVNNVNLVLFRDTESTVFVDNCNKKRVPDIRQSGQLCHVLPTKDGAFYFPVVSPGKYFIMPHSIGRNVHFEPNVIQFEVRHEDIVLPQKFEIAGYSISGRVLSAKNGKPLKGATVFLNGNQVLVTGDDGVYNLDKINANLYTIKVVADQVQFREQTIKIDGSVAILPDFFPSKYEVCGNVLSDKSQSITVESSLNAEMFVTSSVIPEGKFCLYLGPGKYKMHVSVSDAEKAHGIQFFPIYQTIEVIDSPLSGVTFSQLKAVVSGKVNCIKTEDCQSLKVVLRPRINDAPFEVEDIFADLNGNMFKFQNIRPGNYEVFLTPNKFCWKEEKYLLTVNTVEETAPTFVQTGYSVSFVSPHDAEVKYRVRDQKVSQAVHLSKGTTRVCLEKPGLYEFNLDSCHTYENDIIPFSTDAEVNEVYLTPIKHELVLTVAAKENYGDLSLIVNIGGVKTPIGPLPYVNNQYVLTLSLKPEETAILVPQSDVLYVNPPILSIVGHNDCTNLGVQFKAIKGKVFQGKIIPAIPGALITIETENAEVLMAVTDEEGKYRFPPQDDSKNYIVSAKKDTYILVGPNEDGDFIARKLAEVIVEVIDESDTPLQGALLSLSGGESYRSNLQTNEDGKITFASLSPSEYFLKPMMKEYQFSPSSKIIDVKEGATVHVKLRGKRVAYSAFGQVTTLNGEPEERISVVANGINNCTQYSEEATSEQNGNFRIRGLQPYCAYDIIVKDCLDEKRPIERAAPSSLLGMIVNNDLHNIKFTIFRSTPNTDIMVRIFAENPEVYKNLKVKLTRESTPSTVVHTSKIDSSNYKIVKENNVGVLIQIPSVPMDKKQYSLYLESGPLSSKIKANTYYFTANTSFKYIYMEYLTKANAVEQNIKQTSVWTLLFIFVILIAMYNIDITSQFLKDQCAKFNFASINWFVNYFRKPSTSEYVLDANEIDQIVQNINATKRKVKQRRT
uniref:SD-repeat containing protein B domain-containing protein n=1 Tax=Photinus pyralis TaxID=7054 RepID=A0A1Y1NI64_PHOPY